MMLQAQSTTLSALLLQEERHYLFGDEANAIKVFSEHSAENMEKMTMWMFSFQEFANYHEEVVEIAHSILYRFLLTPAGAESMQSATEFQKASIAAFWISTKTYEFVQLPREVWEAITRNTYTTPEIESMESNILSAVGWLVNPPTSYAFVREILELLPTDFVTDDQKQHILELAYLQCNCSIGEVDCLKVPKSTIAIAAVVNAMEALAIPTSPVLAALAGYASDEPRLCAEWCFEVPEIQACLMSWMKDCKDFFDDETVIETEQHGNLSSEPPHSPVTVMITDDERN
ncbi:diatom-specific cyclin [Seminavis robusta]|uniref:Diatom-specific cyclin n=1 Tax=Seminavis robusta TaxID=568900 RepID=A0A9N8DS07_9STRA|nr:diatom-specific cyclin [Seminavis robusta]|eukprot:Sro299_g111470.1 diatom-specific cyclin (288) ;mRNA; f:60287-61150